MEDPDRQYFRSRSGWVIACILIFAFFALCNNFYYAVVKRDELKERAKNTAWRQGKLPAIRGTIYASDGTVLASSKLEFYLTWGKNKAGIAARKQLGRYLRRGDQITEKELALLEPVFRWYPRDLKVETKERRSTSPALKKIEEKYDAVLRGQDGIYVVMLDRFRRRVPGTLKIIREQIHGRSVKLTPEEETAHE